MTNTSDQVLEFDNKVLTQTQIIDESDTDNFLEILNSLDNCQMSRKPNRISESIIMPNNESLFTLKEEQSFMTPQPESKNLSKNHKIQKRLFSEQKRVPKFECAKKLNFNEKNLKMASQPIYQQKKTKIFQKISLEFFDSFLD